MIDLRKRLLSTVCAAAMLFTQAGSILLPVRATELNSFVLTATEPELCQQSFELYPNGEDADQLITLEGLMPEGASAEAIDVSDDYAGIAAYDISITSSSGEFQPEEYAPVLVEINDPVIPGNENIQLWHIRDDGVREQITDFTAESGRISFYASGFSVYEIVVDPNLVPTAASWNKIQSIDELESYDEDSTGLCIGHTSGYYFMSQTDDDGRVGIKKTSKSDVPSAQAVPYYFEKKDGTDDQFYIYCLSGGRQYLKCYVNDKKKGCLTLTADENEKTAFTAVSGESGFRFYSTINGVKWYINMQGGANGKRFCTYADENDVNNNLDLWYPDNTGDIYSLDGKSYGLMYYPGGVHGYALMADDGVHTLIDLVTRKNTQNANDSGEKLFVDKDSEVTKWTFHSDGKGKYKLSGDTDLGEKYLKISGDSLTVCSSADDASSFTIAVGTNGRISLSSEGKYIAFNIDNSGSEPVYSFVLSAEQSAYTWLNTIDFGNLDENELITYSADRVSVSDVADGDRVIVYTRLWDEVHKKYDIYAIDYNGTLYPCYASGGKILWLGDGTCSLEWIFTEYIDEVTKQPNYYYELYNPYSEKYIAPQLSTGKILSDGTIGINMPGRRKGEFFSEIIAWDKDHYAYIGMKPSDDKKRLVPCSQSTSVPFYFATLEELNLSDRLHTVDTVDNTKYGITMKMKDFAGNVSNGDAGGYEQNKYLEYKTFDANNPNSGLLSNTLDENGYPVATKSRLNLGGLYADGQTVNHLFIESIHNSGGYFEFDSTQNFATLVPSGDNNFTVYRELGTSWDQGKSTLRHGQFYPYNTITPGKYSKENSQNLYSADARPGNQNQSVGLLNDDNPRKYEKLYSAGNKNEINYYFGMEMSAQFIQTVSGLDSWGHDIIFEFKGDDDFWFYVDGELVIDLGGIHSALGGKVNFRTGEVEVNGAKTTLIDTFRSNYQNRGLSEAEIDAKIDDLFEKNSKGQYTFKDYTTHNMRVFYMERGAGASNIHMRFNLASVTPGHVVVGKNLSGSGADVIDTDFVEYPFQIYYTLPDEDDPNKEGEEQLLDNDDQHIRVTYQNSTQPVTFVRSYRPPGFSESDAYKNIYFINPAKNAEITFPEDTIGYRIVECAVDSSIYSNVLINGKAVPNENIEIRGDLKSYKSDKITAKERPTITFDNFVQDNVIKDLYITKKLYDEYMNEVTDDPATFNFRLYLSSVDVDTDKIPAVNMYKYHVLSPDKKMCRYDSLTGEFAETDLTYSHDAMRALKAYSNDITDDDEVWIEYNEKHTPIQDYDLEYDDVSFDTSGFGAISGIPAGYTICVPGLPVGSVFKVTEDVKPGYGLLGYECIKGEKINEDHSSEEIASYLPYQGNPDNVGRVRAEENPQVEVKNRKGYGLTVSKKWSDLEITTHHDAVYTAVYVDGEFLRGSVKRIASPSISAYYFWTSLEPKSNGEPRTSFEGYEVREVTLEGSPVVAPDGTVSGYTSVKPLESGHSLKLAAKRTAAATPEGEAADKEYDYVVSYQPGNEADSTRIDTISNNREGGIKLRLFKWDSEIPLGGGNFTLLDSNGKSVGKYTSDSEGRIEILYNYATESIYTLVQTSAPMGYVGLQNKLKFIVHENETVELLKEDGSAWGENKWADWKKGDSGMSAFVDVYNKQFNFKLVKTDSEASDIKLDAAHFALYKQSPTSVSGYVKNKEPLNGFEDMKTVNGEVDVCGGKSGRVIDPGEKGSVFFLTETYAPPNYAKLEDDIIFKISSLGVPSLISTSYMGDLYETEDSYIYTLSVPNERVSNNVELTIEKLVKGAFSTTTKEFTFTFTIDGAGADEKFTFVKNNGSSQTIVSGGEFVMRHNDGVVITVPVGRRITISENNDGYETTFKLGALDTVNDNKLSFELYQPQTLIVVNTRSGSIPTGLSSNIGIAFLMTTVPLAAIAVMLGRRQRRKKT